MNYINFKSELGIETVEDIRDLSYKQKKELLHNYRISDVTKSGTYYFSQRATKDF